MFCTSFINDKDSYERYRRWLDFYIPRKNVLGIDKIMMIDDGSPQEWLLKLTSEYDMIVKPYHEDWDYTIDDNREAVTVLSFAKNYGRPMMLLVPGWWRSFAMSGPISIVNEFDRIIHLESDLFVLSEQLTKRIREFDYGWYTGWCDRIGFMESSLQVIVGDKRFIINDYWKADKNFWYKQNLTEYQYAPEFVLAPHVTTNTKDDRFLGDRYGDDYWEADEIPTDADYIANTHDISLGKQWQKNIDSKAALFELMIKDSNKVILEGAQPRLPEVDEEEAYSLVQFNAIGIYDDLAEYLQKAMQRNMRWLLHPQHILQEPDNSILMMPVAATRMKNLLFAKEPDAESRRIFKKIAIDLVREYIIGRIERGVSEG